jgi:guanylate kinase
MSSNILRNKGQFESILGNYQPSNHVVEILSKASVVLLDGPSGSGRNTIINHLVGAGGYQQVVSDTTRLPRSNNGVLEQHGVEYWFKSEEEFLAGLQEGAYIEAAIIHNQQVSGVSIKEIERALKNGDVAINDVQADGIEAFNALKPDSISIFVTPPSFAIWIKRLDSRGDMPEDERIRRLQSAQEEIQHALSAPYYHFVVNLDLGEAVKAVAAIANKEVDNTSHARQAAEALSEEIATYLLAHHA